MSDKPKVEPQRLSAPPQQKRELSVEERIMKARSNFEVAFKDFHSLLNDKVLKENKSQGAVKNESYLIEQLHRACVELERLNQGEGVMGSVVISLREHLKVRDRVNELEYKLEKAIRDFENLKKDLGGK